ncbi:MAG: DNA polymerase/3'-5' exonuclease PolX, partial [bacterium]
MKVDSARICQIFREMADFLSIKGENPFRVRAYEKAAETLEHLPGDLEELYSQGRLAGIPGIGKGMLEK